MEASALTHSDAVGLRGPTPFLRLQSDERLVALTRRGNQAAYEALVGRYQSRLLAFCRHMLGSREDAEDVLQEVFAAAFNAMIADDRPLNVRPWLYRIARNRSLNHLRKATAIGVDSMDIHYADGGLTTADKVHRREEFRHLVADVQDLPETQRTALLLREIDALSYEQIAEAMDTTVPSVKSLLVRARVSLAEASEARKLTCEEVREELGEVAEGLRRTSAPVRRHVRQCERCAFFRRQLRETNRALAAVYPVGPLLFLKKLVLAHLGTTASAGGGAAAAGAGAAGGAAAAGGASALSAGVGALATKTAATLAAAAIVTAGAVEVDHAATAHRHLTRPAAVASAPVARQVAPTPVVVAARPQPITTAVVVKHKDATAATKTPATTGGATPTAPTVNPSPAPLPQQGYDSTQLPPQPGTMGANGGVAAPDEGSASTTAAQPAPQPQPQPQPAAGDPSAAPQPQPTPTDPAAPPDPQPAPAPAPAPAGSSASPAPDAAPPPSDPTSPSP